MFDRVSCPQCGRAFDLPDTHHGREIRCPECQKAAVVAGSSDFVPGAPTTAPVATHVQPGLPRDVPLPPLVDDLGDADIRLSYQYPTATVATIVQVLLGLNIVASGVTLWGDYLQMELADRLIAGARVARGAVEGNDARQSDIAIVRFLANLLCAIFFLVWFYRAYANLTPLGARTLTYSPGWAVGGWFVPLLNMIRPVQVTQEIWRESDPVRVVDGRVSVESSGNSTRVWIWWAMLIISGMVKVSTNLSQALHSPEFVKSATSFSMAKEIASILAAFMGITVVAGIEARQAERARLLSRPVRPMNLESQ